MIEIRSDGVERRGKKGGRNLEPLFDSLDQRLSIGGKPVDGDDTGVCQPEYFGGIPRLDRVALGLTGVACDDGEV